MKILLARNTTQGDFLNHEWTQGWGGALNPSLGIEVPGVGKTEGLKNP